MRKVSSKVVFRLAIAAATTVGFLIFVLMQGDMDEYLVHITSADPLYLVFGLLTAPISQLIRAARLSLLLNHRTTLPSKTLFRISAIHTAINSVMPARLGEAALPLMMKRECAVDLAHGAGILVTARIYDFLIVLILGGIGATTAYHQTLPGASWLGAGTAVAAAFTAALLPGLAHLTMTLLRRWFGHRRHFGLLERLARGILATTMPRDLLALIVMSLSIWLATFLGFWLTVHSLGIILDLQSILLAGAVVVLAASQPINGVASLGVFEFFWAATLVSFGVSWEIGVAAALVTHAINILGIAMTAAVAVVIPGARKHKEADQPIPDPDARKD